MFVCTKIKQFFFIFNCFCLLSKANLAITCFLTSWTKPQTWARLTIPSSNLRLHNVHGQKGPELTPLPEEVLKSFLNVLYLTPHWTCSICCRVLASSPLLCGYLAIVADTNKDKQTVEEDGICHVLSSSLDRVSMVANKRRMSAIMDHISHSLHTSLTKTEGLQTHPDSLYQLFLSIVILIVSLYYVYYSTITALTQNFPLGD